MKSKGSETSSNKSSTPAGQQPQLNMVRCFECLQSRNNQIVVCYNCLTFVCTICCHHHCCQTGLMLQFQTNLRKSGKHLTNTTNQANSQFLSLASWDAGRIDNRCHKAVVQSCERCCSNAAVKKCSSCNVKYYCQFCFRDVHKTAKLSLHPAVQILGDNRFPNITNEILDITSIKPSSYFKKAHRATLSELSEPFHNQQSDLLLQKRLQILSKNRFLLNALKSQLIFQRNSMEEGIKQSQAVIQRQFTRLNDQVKLKMSELLYKVSQRSKSQLYQCDELLKEIEKSILSNEQFHYLINSKLPINREWQHKIQSKLASQVDQLNTICRRQENLKGKDLSQTISDHLMVEIQFIKQRISKIQIKKNLYLAQDHKNSIISPVKGQRNSFGEQKDKDAKNSMASSRRLSKSSDKSGNLLGLQNKQQKKYEKKRDNEDLLHLSQTQHVKSELNAEEYKTKKLSFKTSVFALKSKNQEKRDIQTKNMGQKTINKPSNKILSPRICQKGEKSGVSQAFVNIEKTKYLIKDMRSEISDFNNRYDTVKSTRNVVRVHTTQQEDQSPNQMSLSHLSIESLVFKGKSRF